MRRILVDKARRRNRVKHGGDLQRITIELDGVPEPADDDLLESLDKALEKFTRQDAVACELVKLRYFAGLSLRDAGRVLELPPRPDPCMLSEAEITEDPCAVGLAAERSEAARKR